MPHDKKNYTKLIETLENNYKIVVISQIYLFTFIPSTPYKNTIYIIK